MNADLERLIALQRLDAAPRSGARLADEPDGSRRSRPGSKRRGEVAAAKERLAENQNARRGIEKDVAVHQGRLSKFREQAMAVKTNQEYHAIQHEIAFAQTEIKKLEDTFSSAWWRPTSSTRRVEARGGAARRRSRRRSTRSAARWRPSTASSKRRSSSSPPSARRSSRALDKQVLAIFEQCRAEAQRRRRRRSARRHLHDLPRPAAAAGVQQRPRERSRSCSAISCNRILYFVPHARQPTRRRPSPRSDRSSPSSRSRRARRHGPDSRRRVHRRRRARQSRARRVRRPHRAGRRRRSSRSSREAIGTATNNVAEYRGLLAALEWARVVTAARAARALGFAAAGAADARQLQGEERRPAAAAREGARASRNEIGRVTFEHVGRA